MADKYWPARLSRRNWALRTALEWWALALGLVVLWQRFGGWVLGLAATFASWMAWQFMVIWRLYRRELAR